MPVALVWFRNDLRLHDNPALDAALRDGYSIIPVYIFDDVTPGIWKKGGASRWYLHQSLERLHHSLESKGSRLILKRGETVPALLALLKETKAEALYCNHAYEPYAMAQEQALSEILSKQHVSFWRGNACLLWEPWEHKTGQNTAFKVFTPFWKQCQNHATPSATTEAPARFPFPGITVKSDALGQWELLPTKPDWAAGFRETWQCGEQDALRRLHYFIEHGLKNYAEGREPPALSFGTSQLSPALHFGEISPHRIWHSVKDAWVEHTGIGTGAEAYLRELGWREFCYHLLHHQPSLPEKPFQKTFEHFPWKDDKGLLMAWQRGLTGYPLIDAGMRQLYAIGWMHNRIRMVCASFLTKHLLISWQQGAAWFWDTLVDADLANNSAGWQWVAGCGADAAPYFRIFNPTTQSERYDPKGTYIHCWVPELRNLPAPYVHAPWKAPQETLRKAGIVLGEHYPSPIIDHTHARNRALASYQKLRNSTLT